MRTRMRTYTALGVLALAMGACTVIADVELPQPTEPPAPPDLGQPSLSTDFDLGVKRYVAAGDRAYVIGAEDGAFPPMGWHIRGEMGGVWAHPIKLLDGYWFSIDGDWLPPAARFTTGAGYARLEHPDVGGLSITRTEFSPDGAPVVLVELDIVNSGEAARDIELKMAARSELMAAYPWGWTMPSAKEANGKDEGQYEADAGRVVFAEPGTPWRALVKPSIKPSDAQVGDDRWGPIPAAEQADYLEHGNGTGAEITWQIRAEAGAVTTLWIAIAGSHTGIEEAEQAASSALADPMKALTDKVTARQELWARTQVELPDPLLQAAFDWAKLNMADLRRTVKQVQVRDVAEGKSFPDPVSTLPEITGIGAGFPDYPWLFGTDGAYTSFPLVASGQWDTAMAHLRAIRDVSRALNGETGKVVHEVMTEGSVYYGNVMSSGNTNETAQFAIAVELLWRWSGDDAFRDEMLDFIEDGLRFITTEGAPPDGLDKDDDGWPEGHGMVERDGMGSEKLDVAVYTHEAMRALERMAAAKGNDAAATWANDEAKLIETKFETAWWMEDLGRYADSLCNTGDAISQQDQMTNGWTNVCENGVTQLQQYHWINATPMEMSLASQEHAGKALVSIEAASGACGLYHTGPGGGPKEDGELKCWTLPTSVMAVGEANYGRLRDNQAMFYIRSIAETLTLETPGALPEIAASPGYDPFVDFRERAMFEQAWSAYGVQWPVVRHILGVDPDVPAGKLAVVPDLPESWPSAAVKNLRVGAGTIAISATRSGLVYTTVVDAPAGLALTLGHMLPADAEVLSVTLDDQPAEPTVTDTPRGRQVSVETTSGAPHTIVVETH